MTPNWTTLLDPPDFPASSYAPLADRIARLFGTRSDIVFVQAEAVLALEAAAICMSRPGLVALNLVTSFYGSIVGGWLRKAGADVRDIVSAPGQPTDLSAVANALATLKQVDLVAWTHGETSTGVVNPLAEIADMARAKGALTIVDAVASAGGHAIDLDALDVVVIGPQKALAGPAGVSIVSCSARAWAHMAAGSAPDASLLSLTGIKRDWIDRGRGALPGMPPPLEFWALDAAIARAEAEGLDAIMHRHRVATSATRAGLHALGLELWVADDAAASRLATTITTPPGHHADALVTAAPDFGVKLNHAGAPMRGRLVRFDHMGRGACMESVIDNVVGFGRMVGRRSETAVAAVTGKYKEDVLF